MNSFELMVCPNCGWRFSARAPVSSGGVGGACTFDKFSVDGRRGGVNL
jgi:rubredoxin